MPRAAGCGRVICGFMGDTRRRRVAIGAASLGIAAACLAVPVARQTIPAPSAASAAIDPPYPDCNAAHADGRYSIPSSDPAYRPDLDLDKDGLACEPSKGRRSTR
ncbi:MAG: excalibur calcium-binding domain-containing protein [Mycobacterium sp.]